MPDRLPIFELRGELRSALKEGNRVIVRAPTGSGKSTQIPQMLLDDGLAGDGEVVVMQPRRLAARMLAARVARERGVALGGEVGYQVRFDARVGSGTRLRYVTEGVLLRRMLESPTLEGVSAIVFDEFHERHLYGDVTFGHARTLQESRRPDLRLLVMSATMATEKLEAYLAGARVLRSEGRVHPVEIRHRPPPGRRRDAPPIWETAADAAAALAAELPDGHILVFMPGAWEIQRTIEALREQPCARGFAVLPLHGELPPERQDEAVVPSAGRRIIVATNIAETSITIDGVRGVVDSGLARIPRYDPARGIDTLLVEPISRASADQRAGRAGRTAPGVCVRLWSEAEHRGRPAEETPEVWRVDLAEVALALKAAGYRDLAAFPWLDPPGPERVLRAEQLLADLGATDADGGLTDVGRQMLAFPVHPRHARMLIEAGRRRAVGAAAAVAALVQGRDIFLPRVERDVEERRAKLFGDDATSDFLPRLRALVWAERQNWNPAAGARMGVRMNAAREIAALRDRFRAIAAAEGLSAGATAPDEADLRRCILAGFADHVAVRLDRGTLRCALTRGRRGELARSSAVRDAPLIVVAEVRETEGREIGVILTLATAISPEWLREMFPSAVRDARMTEWDLAARRAVGWACRMYHDLVLERRPAEPDAVEAARLLADRVVAGDLRPEGVEAAAQWLRRVELVARLRPECGVRPPAPDETAAAALDLCRGAVSAREVSGRSLAAALRARWTPAEQAAVEREAPERITLSNGRAVRVTYEAGGEPWIAATIQHLYGVREAPRIAGGRGGVVVRVLAPNQRPVQVTRDLEGFWRREYPRVRAELARRYPKHEWR